MKGAVVLPDEVACHAEVAEGVTPADEVEPIGHVVGHTRTSCQSISTSSAMAAAIAT